MPPNQSMSQIQDAVQHDFEGVTHLMIFVSLVFGLVILIKLCFHIGSAILREGNIQPVLGQVDNAADVAPSVGPIQPMGPGYHLQDIERGVFGEFSKIREEAAEVADAESQGVRLMALVEMSDLYGAIQGYLERHHPTVTVADLGDPVGCGAFVGRELQEVSEIYRNMCGHLSTKHPDTSIEDLRMMSGVTQRAFRNGRRG